GVRHGSLAGRSPPLLMFPRFADIFQQGNLWLNWLEKQPEGSVRPVVIESVTKIRWRGMYQQLLKVAPLKCILCGSQMHFTGLKRGYRLADLVVMHEPLARMWVCS
ncbi:TPA: hypothetical protein ACF9O4_005654, partial [Escherichia coli]